MKKIIYFTDGTKQHFKNRYQMANLVCHKEYFNFDAEWHFSATAHGKIVFDGVGACFKREAYRASLLAKPTKFLLTPEAVLEWAKIHFQYLKIHYFDKVYHGKIRRKLNKRLDSALPVTGIMNNH